MDTMDIRLWEKCCESECAECSSAAGADSHYDCQFEGCFGNCGECDLDECDDVDCHGGHFCCEEPACFVAAPSTASPSVTSEVDTPKEVDLSYVKKDDSPSDIFSYLGELDGRPKDFTYLKGGFRGGSGDVSTAHGSSVAEDLSTADMSLHPKSGAPTRSNVGASAPSAGENVMKLAPASVSPVPQLSSGLSATSVADLSNNFASTLASSLANASTSNDSFMGVAADHLYCHWDGHAEEFKFDNEIDFTKHLQEFHAAQQSVEDKLCHWDGSCTEPIPESENLLEHIKKEHAYSFTRPHAELCLVKDDAPHVCYWMSANGEPCGKVCDGPAQLADHLHSHVGTRQKQYTCMWQNCERCQRPFPQRQKIIRHLQTHTKNKPYVCHICHKRFAEESVLVQHIRVHTGEKPYKCKFCGKSFAASTALSIHIRTHTGEKPLQCKYCGRRFAESSNLAKHVKSHRAEEFSAQVKGADLLKVDLEMEPLIASAFT